MGNINAYILHLKLSNKFYSFLSNIYEYFIIMPLS